MASAKGISLYLDALSPGAPAFATHDMNQATDQLEFIFQAKTLEPITRLGFRQGALSGVAPVFRVSLQGADPANGNPDGSIKAAGAAFVDYTPTLAKDNAWQWVQLGTPYTPSFIGEQLALVIAYQSGTIDGSNHCTFTVSHNVAETPGMTYAITNNAGTRARAAASPCFGYGTADTAFGMPATAIISAAFFQSGERGFKFMLPTGWFHTYTLRGVRWNTSQNPTATFRMRLYDENGVDVLQERNVDWDINQSASGGVRYHEALFSEATLARLRTGVWYRVTRYVITTPAGLSEHGLTVAADNDMEAYPLGANLIKTRREVADMIWLDDTLSRPLVGLILGDLYATAPTESADEPVSLRVINIIAQWFSESPDIVTVGTDLRDYTNDLKATDKPALYVLRGTPRQELIAESNYGIAEPLAVDLVGYVEATATPPDAPEVTATRERFLQVVLRRLYEVSDSGDSLKKRLEDDFATNGNGAQDLRHIAPPLTDQGYEPPHGIFELPCLAMLHYEGASF